MNPKLFKHYKVTWGVKGAATAVVDLSDDTEIRFGFAFCSPMEKNFCRKKGREVAEENLQANPQVLHITKEDRTPLLVDTLVRGMLLKVARQRKISWLRGLSHPEIIKWRDWARVYGGV